MIKYLLAVIFLISKTTTYSQKTLDTKHLKNLLSSALYDGQISIKEHERGIFNIRHSDYLKAQEYEISNIYFLGSVLGDFNKNGIPDIFATLQIKQKTRDNIYVCLIETDNNTITIYRYFEMGPYSKVTFKNIKNDTLQIRSEMWNKKKEVFINRFVSLIHDDKNIIQIVTPNKLDAMKDISIFKSHLKNVKRTPFVSNQIIRSRDEEYRENDLFIAAELSGFNDLSLRFTITKNNLNENFDKTLFVKEMFEFLKSNTRFPTILTNIEKVMLSKKEENQTDSNRSSYDIKNYTDSHTYFITGEQGGADTGFYQFDLIYLENENN